MKFKSNIYKTRMIHHHNRPRGPTDKASDYESGDCGFESHRGCFFLFSDFYGTQ
jgi:hypothetical protein